MICKIHNEEKVTYGKQHKCKSCNKEYQKKWYKDNKETHSKRVRKNTKERVNANRQRMWDHYKSHPCVDCGESNPIVLESDHIGEKSYRITQMVNSGGMAWSSILKELEKCETRCANCHRIKTAKQLGWYKGINK